MSNLAVPGRMLLVVLCAAVLAAPARASGSAPILADQGRAYTVPVRTLKELKLARSFRTTVRQQYDFSCGSAAVATLLTYHYGLPVSEAEVFEAMFAGGDRNKIRREGFSLLDMKRYLEKRGFRADGVRIPLEELAAAGVPAIALVSERGYRHFVVIKGVRDGRVMLGDPALGTRIVDEEQLEKSRVGDIYFVIRDHLDAALFNAQNDWNSRLHAPIGLGVERDSIATQLLTIPGPDRF